MSPDAPKPIADPNDLLGTYSFLPWLRQGLANAITSPPATPWLTTQTWVRLFRPHLEFCYVNNAYQFYSPQPGPAAHGCGDQGAIGRVGTQQRRAPQNLDRPREVEQLEVVEGDHNDQALGTRHGLILRLVELWPQ